MDDHGEYGVFTSTECQENVFSNNYLSQKKDLFDPQNAKKHFLRHIQSLFSPVSRKYNFRRNNTVLDMTIRSLVLDAFLTVRKLVIIGDTSSEYFSTGFNPFIPSIP